MASLYVLGGRQRKLLLKGEEEWNLYDAALVLRLDTESGSVKACVEYETPSNVRASAVSSVLFKSGTLVRDTLYACTSTEVLVFKLPEFERVGYISLPCFNDLHHVAPASDGTLLAANTGLDMVVKFTKEGNLLNAWGVLDEAPWSRFSPATDYRKIESTKPHKSHPNFVFEMNNETWVTRFTQRDAICLNDRTKRIDIGVAQPHDGLLRGHNLYFTTVDGRVVVADAHSLQVKETVNLQSINGHDALLGWCRGLLPIDKTKLWVGFTRIRKTQFKENILWVKSIFRPGMGEKPTHIALYDIEKKRCIQEFDLEAHGMNIVFSIFPADPRHSNACS